jgi:hypothetical protein
MSLVLPCQAHVILEITREDTQFLPGYGHLASRAGPRQLRAVLDLVVKLVRVAHEKWLTSAEIKELGLLKEHAEYAGGNISSERMIDIVYHEITQ